VGFAPKGRLNLPDVLHLIHYAPEASETLLVVYLLGPARLDLLLVALLGEEDLQIAVEIWIGLLNALEVEGLPMLPHLLLPLLPPVVLVEAAVATLPDLHELNEVLKLVLALPLLDDGQFDLLHLLDRVSVLLEEVADHGLGVVDRATGVAPAW
jgi:hypothetical protein